jgi:tRNA pseudouridine38-40 synthase
VRYALGIEYDGSDFLGWQRHGNGPTVQAAVEAALGFVADAPIDVVCSGRTDAGVHAACQVVHFDSEAKRDARAWVLGANTRLPGSVRVLWCRPVDAGFHARYAARARCYRYSILNRDIPPGMQRQYLSWERLPLDADAMHRAAQSLLGEHDFSAFRTVQCQAKHPIRSIHSISVIRDADQLQVDVQANAFLHHMVRNIVGSLIPVGRGEQAEAWPGVLLRGKDRSVAGPTAPAAGLVFLGPKFPAEWALPAAVTL